MPQVFSQVLTRKWCLGDDVRSVQRRQILKTDPRTLHPSQRPHHLTCLISKHRKLIIHHQPIEYTARHVRRHSFRPRNLRRSPAQNRRGHRGERCAWQGLISRLWVVLDNIYTPRQNVLTKNLQTIRDIVQNLEKQSKTWQLRWSPTLFKTNETAEKTAPPRPSSRKSTLLLRPSVRPITKSIKSPIPTY